MRKSNHVSYLGVPAALLVLGLVPFGTADASEGLAKAVRGGKFSANVRYRIEQVDEDNAKQNAAASTLRTRLGYLTGAVGGARFYLEYEDITGVIEEDYDSGSNGKTSFSKVVDPEITEVNQAHIRYSLGTEVAARIGRQRIILDNARHVGNVGWRQNEQTFDALSINAGPNEEVALSYSYITNINSITGANTDTQTHLLNGRYGGLSSGNLTGYAYLIDMEQSTADSQTVGLRFSGEADMSDEFRLLYSLEMARQGDYADAPGSVDADYLYADLGGELHGVTARLANEVLGGDGVYGFQTPLATKHAFNGWSDKFLSTPADGLNDLIASVSGKVRGTKLIAVYHDFSADNGGADYGTEMNMLAVRKLRHGMSVGLKYAAYDAGSHSVDTDKLWLWGQVSF